MATGREHLSAHLCICMEANKITARGEKIQKTPSYKKSVPKGSLAYLHICAKPNKICLCMILLPVTSLNTLS